MQALPWDALIFLHGGGAEMGKAGVELLYFVLEGEMTVTTEDGQVHVLHTGDSIHFAPQVGRSSVNTGNVSAQMLVIACPAKA